MKERMKQLRKSLGMTQEKFASKIGLSRNFITQIELGTKFPSDRTIVDICREFGVNEEWLRNGTGEMYKELEDEVAAVVSDLLEEDNPFYDLIIGIMKTYQKLDSKSQEALNNLGKELLRNIRKEG